VRAARGKLRKPDSARLPAMSEDLLFLKTLHVNQDGTCTDWDVRESNDHLRARGMKAAVFAFIALVLVGCVTDSSDKCSRASADPECPVGTPARTESDYKKDISGIDDASCRAVSGNSLDKYQKCMSDRKWDRQ
jgi:hypothetical protein